MHLSLASGTPSPSLSGSGQPSSSWKPSLSSGSIGHLSLASGTPSPSLSLSGQPSSSWKPSLSSASFGHLSTSSIRPSPSVSFSITSSFFESTTANAPPPNRTNGTSFTAGSAARN